MGRQKRGRWNLEAPNGAVPKPHKKKQKRATNGHWLRKNRDRAKCARGRRKRRRIERPTKGVGARAVAHSKPKSDELAPRPRPRHWRNELSCVRSPGVKR